MIISSDNVVSFVQYDSENYIAQIKSPTIHLNGAIIHYNNKKYVISYVIGMVEFFSVSVKCTEVIDNITQDEDIDTHLNNTLDNFISAEYNSFLNMPTYNIKKIIVYCMCAISIIIYMLWIKG